MIRQPIGLRLNPSPERSIRDQIRQAATLGARGVVLDAAGDLGPQNLSATGRRELRNLLRTVELTLVALNLPTRRPFDSFDQIDERLARAEGAFAMAYELGCTLVLARVGGVPEEAETARREAFEHALGELGRRADHRGVRFAVETGAEPGATLSAFLEGLGLPSLAASIDPGSLLRSGHDPVAATRALGSWVAHAYAGDATTTGGGSRVLVADSQRAGFPPGALDWEEYLGALEEIDYRGYLTIWPDPAANQAAAFQTIKARLDRF